jgi:hypothetical protein
MGLGIGSLLFLAENILYISNLAALKSRLVAGFSVTGLVSFWLSAPIRKSARYEEALVR